MKVGKWIPKLDQDGRMKVENVPQFKPINQIKQNSGNQYVPKPYLDMAEGMESQFTEMMYKEMEKTTGKEEGSTSENYYNSLLNEQRAKIASADDGVGIKKIILDQIYPAKFRNKENYEAYVKTQNLHTNKTGSQK